jgi:sensor domain CHASE-containing protein
VPIENAIIMRKTSLQIKLLSIILGSFILIGLIDYIIQQTVIYPIFIELERQTAESNLQRSKLAIDQELSILDKLCTEYSSWTDTYEYIQEPYTEYEVENFSEENLIWYGLHMFVLLNESNEVVWRK